MNLRRSYLPWQVTGQWEIGGAHVAVDARGNIHAAARIPDAAGGIPCIYSTGTILARTT